MKLFKKILCFGLAMLLYVPMVNTGSATESVEDIEDKELIQIETKPVEVEVETVEANESTQVKVNFIKKKAQSRVEMYAKIGAAAGAILGGFCGGIV